MTKHPGCGANLYRAYKLLYDMIWQHCYDYPDIKKFHDYITLCHSGHVQMCKNVTADRRFFMTRVHKWKVSIASDSEQPSLARWGNSVSQISHPLLLNVAIFCTLECA